MVRVVYPIHLDRWRSSIATSLREVALRNPTIHFYSFSHPLTKEDQHLSPQLWNQSHIHRMTKQDLLQIPFDIIHHASATTRNLTAVAIAKVRSRGRCIHLFTAPIQPHREDTYYAHYLTAIRTANVVTAMSHATATEIFKKLGRKVDAVIPSGVNLDVFSPQAARPLALEQWEIRQPFVLFAAALTPRKRPDVFIQLAALMPELDFVLLGNAYNPTEQALYQKAALEQPNIKLLGTRPLTELRDWMAQALALIFPSELEGLALTLLNAAAMGLPILAQPKSSMPEVVIDDVTGWLLPVDDLRAWVAKLKDIQQWAAADRTQFGQRAREFVAQHYSWDGVAQQYAQLYQQLSHSSPHSLASRIDSHPRV